MDPVTGAVLIVGLHQVGKPATKVVTDFLGKVLAPTADAFGTAIAHPVVEWQKRRVERAAKVVEEAATMLSEAGIEPRPVPGRVLLPILERSSLEEDTHLHARWVRLLAQAASDENVVPPAFVSMLAELTPGEAILLDWIYKTTERVHEGITYFGETSSPKACLDLNIETRRAEVMVGNLVRLGTIRHPFEIDGYWVEEIVKNMRLEEVVGYSKTPAPMTEAIANETKFTLTDLGAAFVRACSPLTEPAGA